MIWTAQDYSRLSSLIFEAALDANKWVDFLNALSEVNGGVRTHIFGQDFATNTPLDVVSSQYDPDFIRSFRSYYGQKNAWVTGFSKADVGQTMRSEAMVETEVLVQTEFYNDWVKPQENIISGGGTMLYKDADHMVAVGGNIRAKDQDRLQLPFLELLQALSPQLVHAISVNRAMASASLQKQVLDQLGGPFDTGVLVIGPSGAIVFANDPAQYLLEDGQVVGVDQLNKVVFANVQAQQRLEQAIKSLVRKNHVFTDAFLIPPVILGMSPCKCHLTRMNLEQDGQVGFLQLGSEVRGACLMITLSAPDQADKVVEVLSSAYRLTEAEIRVVLDLETGLSLREMSDTRQISIHTVRNQLKSAMFKLDVHRQTEVLRLISSLRQSVNINLSE